MRIESKRNLFVLLTFLAVLHLLIIAISIAARSFDPLIGIAVIDLSFLFLAGLSKTADYLFPDKPSGDEDGLL